MYCLKHQTIPIINIIILKGLLTICCTDNTILKWYFCTHNILVLSILSVGGPQSTKLLKIFMVSGSPHSQQACLLANSWHFLSSSMNSLPLYCSEALTLSVYCNSAFLLNPRWLKRSKRGENVGWSEREENAGGWEAVEGTVQLATSCFYLPCHIPQLLEMLLDSIFLKYIFFPLSPIVSILHMVNTQNCGLGLGRQMSTIFLSAFD